MRRVLAAAVLATAALAPATPATADVCALNLLCTVGGGCTGTVNVCAGDGGCRGTVSVCPWSDPDDCHSTVDVCLDLRWKELACGSLLDPVCDLLPAR